jgi:hypothetical protein
VTIVSTSGRVTIGARIFARTGDALRLDGGNANLLLDMPVSAVNMNVKASVVLNRKLTDNANITVGKVFAHCIYSFCRIIS